MVSKAKVDSVMQLPRQSVPELEPIWGSLVREATVALENGSESKSPKDSFLDLCRFAISAYGGDVPAAEGYEIEEADAQRLSSNSAAAPLLLFLLKALTRYSSRIKDRAKPTSTEIRAALCEAFYLTKMTASGKPKRGSPGINEGDRIEKYFEDALYRSAMLGYGAVICNEMALLETFKRRYKLKYRGLASQARGMMAIKITVRDRDLAFDHDEDMSAW